MARTKIRRYVAAGAAVSIGATGLVTLLSAVSSAAVIGSLTITPTTGADDTPISVRTSSGCPSGGTNITVRVLGPGFPAAGQVVVGNTDAGVSQSGPFSVPLSDTLRAFASQQNPPATLNGKYTLDLRCQDAFGTQDLGNFTGTLTFSGPSSYTAAPAASPSASATPTSTASPRPTATATTAPTTAPPTTRPPTTAPPTTAPPVAQGFALRISPEYARVKSGAVLQLATRLVRSNGAHVPGQRVGFYTRPRGGSQFVLSRRTVTDGAGLSFATFTVRDDFRYFTNYNTATGAVGARSIPGLVQIVR